MKKMQRGPSCKQKPQETTVTLTSDKLDKESISLESGTILTGMKSVTHSGQQDGSTPEGATYITKNQQACGQLPTIHRTRKKMLSLKSGAEGWTIAC